jgi:glucose-1-phosphate thymidylyltransferase
MTITAVIMHTAGAGSTGGPLQRVANRPIVCHVLDQLQPAGVDKAAIVVPRWDLDELRASVLADGPNGLGVTYVTYGHDRTFDDALGTVADLVGDGSCLIHASDGLPTQPLTDLVRTFDRDAPPALVAFVHRSSAGSTALATRRLLRSFGHPFDGESLEIASVCMLGPGALRRSGSSRWWQSGRLELTSLAEQLSNEGARIAIQPIDGWIQHGGSTRQLLDLNRFLLDALPSDPASAMRISDGVNRIEGCVVVHPRARVESSTIVGPAIVGADASVLNAYIGPYTSIGAGVRVEGAEIERSIILPGASITHIGGRLGGSVVGRDALVFRDFSLPRALRLNVGDGGEVALC